MTEPSGLMDLGWRVLLLVGGACGAAGGLLHPDQDPTLTGDAALAAWVGNPMWIPSHLLILASVALLVPGLLGLARSGVLAAAARTAVRIAFGASILWLVESVPHLLAALDEGHLLAGEPAPFLNGHLLGGVVVYPLAGLSLAALALLGGRALAHPVLNVLGAVGAVAFAFAPVAVGPLGIESLSALFAGLPVMFAWLAAVGTTALIRRESGGAPQTGPGWTVKSRLTQDSDN